MIVAFRDTSAHRIYEAFRDIPYALLGETRYIQHRHFGAVIAIAYCNLVGGTLRRVGLVG